MVSSSLIRVILPRMKGEKRKQSFRYLESTPTSSIVMGAPARSSMLMIIHEPFVFEEFTPDTWGDVLVAGHTHGGTAKIPVLGPAYTPEGGFLPERSGCLVYGRYDVQGSPLIVSSGLENRNLLRINNSPEIVIVDINRF